MAEYAHRRQGVRLRQLASRLFVDLRFKRLLCCALIAFGLLPVQTLTLSIAESSPSGAVPSPPMWTLSESLPPTATPNAISCPSTTTCFATVSGTIGGILKTTDDGSRWTYEVDPVGTTQLVTIACPSITTCFAGGGSLINGGQIIETTDGGAHWSMLALPYSAAEAENFDIYDIAGIACPDDNTCYATVGLGNGSVLITTDGGATWTPEVLQGTWYISGISCPDDLTCYIAGNGPTGLGSITATTDGGQVWEDESQALPHQGGNYDMLSAIACPTALACFATGDQKIVATTNGGLTWSFQAVPQATSGIGTIACPDSSLCFATSLTNDSIAILNTNDGGSQWSLQTTFAQTNAYVGISCPSSIVCVAVSSTDSASTQNAGANWSTAPLSAGSSTSNAISCPSASECFASTGLGVISTMNGGASWSSDLLPPSVWPNEGGYVEDISCPSTQTCFVAHGAQSSSQTTPDRRGPRRA